jgi:hypothetical protein
VQVEIRGASDDLVIVDINGKKTEQRLYDGTWVADLTARDGSGIAVHATYIGSLWHLGAGPLPDPDGDDGATMPPWSVRILPPWGDRARYSPVLQILAPDGTQLAVRAE